MLSSVVCRYEHFSEPWFDRIAVQFELYDLCCRHRPVRNTHRKIWEWVSITQALSERGKLKAGMRGIGFAVGQEPLTSIFASCGANVLASDIATGDVADEWSRTGQHASSLEALHKPGLVSREDFDKRVSFEPVNMTDLSSIASGQFDFAWSACSLEHLGSLAAGLEFIKNTVRLLKPGGISVHTTEYNVSSNEETIETGETVIFREQDLRRLEGELRDMNACLARLDLFEGLHRHDIEADYLPYHENGRQHIKLRIGQFTATSVLLIVQN